MIDSRESARKRILALARRSRLDRILAPWLQGRGAILMLHSVTAVAKPGRIFNDHLRIAPAFLDQALSEIRRQGIALVSMDEVVEHLRSGSRARVASVTADDGYRDNMLEALPVLESHEAPLTIYIAPAMTDGRVLAWWEVLEEAVVTSETLALPPELGGRTIETKTRTEKIAAFVGLFGELADSIPEPERQSVLARLKPDSATSPLLGWDDLRTLAAHQLVTVGAHTVHHYSLGRLESADALAEMSSSANMIAEHLGAVPRHFAFPYGHERAAGMREVELAREAGFSTAVTTRHGTLQAEHRDHLHALPRISLNGRYQEIGYLRTMLTGFTTYANARRRVVTL